MSLRSAPMGLAEYATPNIALASYLILRGHRLTGIRRGGYHGSFFFADGPSLREDALAFLSRTAQVEPLGFIETLRHLKGEVRTA